MTEGETRRRRGRRVTGGGGVVKEEQGGGEGVLQSSSRCWLGRRRSGAVNRWWDLLEDAGGGEKWSPGVVSRWFELSGVAAPSADEG
jgi:hypothetical protein